MSDSEDVDYEIVSNDSQTGPPPKLRREKIVLPEWLNPRGKANAFLLWELSTGEHGEFDASDKVFDEHGQVVRLIPIGWDVRFLAYTVRDGSGNRIWPTIEQAEAKLKPAGKSITNKMVSLAKQVNYGDPTAADADEAVASAEKNSGENSPAETSAGS